MEYQIEWNGGHTWVKFALNGHLVAGYTDFLISDGGYYKDDGTFVKFCECIQQWLEDVDAIGNISIEPLQVVDA